MDQSNRFKVVIAEDSLVFQKALENAVRQSETLTCSAVAGNGLDAIVAIEKHHPDVLILDLEMPILNGIETLKALAESKLRPKVTVVFAGQSRDGADLTMEAMRLGAIDFITKPSAGSLTAGQRAIREVLIPQIEALALTQCRKSIETDKKIEPKVDVATTVTRGCKNIVAIGVSTGGPQALMQIVQELPDKLAVPIVVVQHMPPVFTERLASRLNELTKLTVKEAQDLEPVVSDTIYIAPGGRHMIVTVKGSGRVISIIDTPPVNSCRPSVDVLFESIAKAYGGNALGIVLTGIGRDGTDGARLLREQGSPIIAQDEATSTVFGMPKTVIEAGLANEIVGLDDVALRIVFHTQRR
jgi:two-component system chemotaxis response regulator CheB